MSVKIIVGLGNPGKKYAGTRHNVGSSLVEQFAREQGVEFSKKSGLKASVAVFDSGDDKIVLALPATYMNLSGQAVSRLKKFYKAANSRILVVVDDLDLPLGKLRLRAGGSSGGHNGLKSVEAAIRTREYPRLRIGIGRPEAVAEADSRSPEDVPDHVLSSFTPSEKSILKGVLGGTGTRALGLWINEPIHKAMTDVNQAQKTG